MECPFCNLDKEESRTLRKGKFSTVILSNPRLMKGHCLVIPNRHIEKPWELKPDELQDIFENIFWVQQKLLNSLATGTDVRQNYRPFLAEGRTKVNHLHFHVLPRTNDDELYKESMQYEKNLFQDMSDAERQKMRQLFNS